MAGLFSSKCGGEWGMTTAAPQPTFELELVGPWIQASRL
jgi:hypothetical protein